MGIIQCSCDLDDDQFWALMSDCAINCPEQGFDAPEKDPVSIRRHYCDAITPYISEDAAGSAVVDDVTSSVGSVTTPVAVGTNVTTSAGESASGSATMGSSSAEAGSTRVDTVTGGANGLVSGVWTCLAAVFALM